MDSSFIMRFLAIKKNVFDDSFIHTLLSRLSAAYQVQTFVILFWISKQMIQSEASQSSPVHTVCASSKHECYVTYEPRLGLTYGGAAREHSCGQRSCRSSVESRSSGDKLRGLFQEAARHPYVIDPQKPTTGERQIPVVFTNGHYSVQTKEQTRKIEKKSMPP